MRPAGGVTEAATLSVCWGRQASVPGDVTIPELLPLGVPLLEPVETPLEEPFELVPLLEPLDEPPFRPPDELPFDVVPLEDPLVSPPDDPAAPPPLLDPPGGLALPQLDEPHWSVPSAVRIDRTDAQVA